MVAIVRCFLVSVVSVGVPRSILRRAIGRWRWDVVVVVVVGGGGGGGFCV